MSPAFTRSDLEDAVERAIALLNAWDGDPDLEPEIDDDVECEASLCGVTFGHGSVTNLGRAGGFTFDLEEACEDEGHDSDREPELGE